MGRKTPRQSSRNSSVSSVKHKAVANYVPISASNANVVARLTRLSSTNSKATKRFSSNLWQNGRRRRRIKAAKRRAGRGDGHFKQGKTSKQKSHRLPSQ